MLIAVRLRGLDMTTEEMDTAEWGHWSATGLGGHDGAAGGASRAPGRGYRGDAACEGETGPSGAGDGDTGADKGDEGRGQEEEEEEAYIGSGL